MSALATRIRSLSLSGNYTPPSPPASVRTFTPATTIDPVNSQFHHIIHTFLDTPKGWVEEQMRELIQGPTNQILDHCIQNMRELTGEGLLLRLWTISYLCRMFAPTVDLNELMYESLCTITDSFFAQDHGDRFDFLYGDIPWIHEGLNRDSRYNVDFALGYVKSSDQNGPLRLAIEPPVALLDARHPWHLKALGHRTIVHDWYALCYWLIKLTPLKPPRGSAQATDQLHCIFGKWVEKHPELSGKTVVQAGSGLSVIANYLEPGKTSLQRSPRPLRRVGAPHEPLSPFIKLCTELNHQPLDLATWTKHNDSKLIIQMAMNQFSARTTLLVLSALHTQTSDEEPYTWLTKIDNFETNVLLRHIQQDHFDAPSLFEFFRWIMWPNQSFAVRLSIAESILEKLERRETSFEEMRQLFNQLHVFFEEATREGYYKDETTKAPLRSLVDAVFLMPLHVTNDTTDVVDTLRNLLRVAGEIEQGLYPAKTLENRLYEKCTRAFANSLTKVTSPLKRVFLSKSVEFYNAAALAETRDRMYPDIRQIAAATENEGLGIRFDETSAKLVTHELQR